VDKKPLIVVSICAVVLLVLGSLSNVVGYQSVKSTTVNDSPLFSIKIQEATFQKKNIITSQYLGKGKSTIVIPIQDNGTEFVHKIFGQINKMDEITFTEFLNKIINRLSYEKKFMNIDINEIIKGFRYLKNNPEQIKQYVNNANETYTLENQIVSVCPWKPGCFIQDIVSIIKLIFFWLIIFPMIYFVLTALSTSYMVCYIEK
jgi:hypothetical protein